MALPKISKYPTKTVVLPLSGQKVTFRPFLVKEEKILILLRDSSDKTPEDELTAVINICEACTFGKVKIRSLPITDVEYLFLQIRAVSKGKISRLNYRCKNVPDTINGQPNTRNDFCDTLVQVGVDLEKVEVKKDPEFRMTFEVPGEDMVIHMKYPTINLNNEVTEALASGKINEVQAAKIIMANCVSMVTQGDTVYKDFTQEEFEQFMDDIVGSVFEEINTDFLNRFPELEKTVEFKCPKCGHSEELTLRGLSDFF